VSRAIDLLFIAVGVALVNRALDGNLTTLLLACLLTALNTDLFVSTAQFFETGLTFVAMAALYYTVTPSAGAHGPGRLAQAQPAA